MDTIVKPLGCAYPNCNCHYGTGCKGNKEYLERQNKEKNDNSN